MGQKEKKYRPSSHFDHENSYQVLFETGKCIKIEYLGCTAYTLTNSPVPIEQQIDELVKIIATIRK